MNLYIRTDKDIIYLYCRFVGGEAQQRLAESRSNVCPPALELDLEQEWSQRAESVSCSAEHCHDLEIDFAGRIIQTVLCIKGHDIHGRFLFSKNKCEPGCHYRIIYFFELQVVVSIVKYTVLRYN